MTLRTCLLISLFLSGLARPVWAETVTVAVAANFFATAENVAAAFEAETGHQVALVHGSSGKLFAQIMAGAPYDVFLSADSERPARLILEGRVAGISRPYAFGRLVLVVRKDDPTTLQETLTHTELRLAIADPAVAPYGIAAREVLERFRGENWATNVVFGESVGQAFTFFATGNTEMALVAKSQTLLSDIELFEILVPEDFHSPVRQDAVLLARAAGNPAAVAFYTFLDASLARSIIVEAGYGVRE